MSFDAVLILSFGGPEAQEDVMPFLRNVTRKRNVPDERLATVAKQYAQFGGKSPINGHCRELVAALKQELKAHNINLPVYWGNRNWDPYVTDTAKKMSNDGITNALTFATSGFSSYSGCRQYREDLERAANEHDGLSLTKLRLFYNHPYFIEAFAANVQAAMDDLPSNAKPRIVFTAHSIPLSMAATSEYEVQLHEAARLVAEYIGLESTHWDIAFQSRSGPPTVAWLEPDINDHLTSLASKDDTSAVVVAPLGFMSDHMEVLFDLDTQAKKTAEKFDLAFRRARTVGTDPLVIAMIRELIQERLFGAEPRALGSQGPWPDECPDNHCALPTRPSRQPKAISESSQPSGQTP